MKLSVLVVLALLIAACTLIYVSGDNNAIKADREAQLKVKPAS